MVLTFLDRVVRAAAVFCLAASAAMIIANVFYRYVVLGWFAAWSKQAAWITPLFDVLNGLFGAISVTADEVPGYLLVWIAFLGAYLAMRRDGHISFDVLVEALPRSLRRGIGGGVEIAMLVFLGMLLWQSLRMIRIDGGTEIETADIAQGWFMAIMPISAVLLALPFGHRLYRRIIDRQDGP